MVEQFCLDYKSIECGDNKADADHDLWCSYRCIKINEN